MLERASDSEDPLEPVQADTKKLLAPPRAWPPTIRSAVLGVGYQSKRVVCSKRRRDRRRCGFDRPGCARCIRCAVSPEGRSTLARTDMRGGWRVLGRGG